MIFYFSATGNTRKLAQAIATRTQDLAIDIETALQEGRFEYELKDGERLGFCCPVYFGTVPQVMQDFIRQLKVKTGTGYYCFVAVTSGGLCAYAPQILIQKLFAQGLTTNAAFELVAIDTFLPMYTIPTGEVRQKIEAETALKTDFIAEQILDKDKGNFYKKGIFPRVSTLGMAPLYKVMNKTKYFKVSDKCNGCGKCSQHCPIQAISMDEEKHQPLWKSDTCMLCMRCVHHCPQEAIDYGKMTVGKTRYRI